MPKCAICQFSDQDELKFGEFLTKNGMSVHLFCLYLSSQLTQSGEDDEGFYGFLPSDIRHEVKRISRLKCYYCSRKYANIGCCSKNCKRSFHLICGVANFTDHEFIGTYRSFCHSHSKARLQRIKPSNDEICCICYDDLMDADRRFIPVNMIQAPCCQNGWFHKICLQNFASKSGYFFKCPLCNDTELFRNKLRYKGIFIPDRDAAWELEPNAFAELLERPKQCSAEVCFHKGGREHKSARDPFLICTTCGSKAVHVHCMDNASSKVFNCEECKRFLANDSGNDSYQALDNNDSESEEVDVCELDSDNCEIVNSRSNSDDNSNTISKLPDEGIHSESSNRMTDDANDREDKIISTQGIDILDPILEEGEEEEIIRIPRRQINRRRVPSSDTDDCSAHSSDSYNGQNKTIGTVRTVRNANDGNSRRRRILSDSSNSTAEIPVTVNINPRERLNSSERKCECDTEEEIKMPRRQRRLTILKSSHDSDSSNSFSCISKSPDCSFHLQPGRRGITISCSSDEPIRRRPPLTHSRLFSTSESSSDEVVEFKAIKPTKSVEKKKVNHVNVNVKLESLKDESRAPIASDVVSEAKVTPKIKTNSEDSSSSGDNSDHRYKLRRFMSLKRKNSLSSEESSDDLPLRKMKSYQSKCKEYYEKNLPDTDSEDDDPLDDFEAVLQKSMENSKRSTESKCNSSSRSNSDGKGQKAQESKKSLKNAEESETPDLKMTDQTNNKNPSMDESCVAKRTRRMSVLNSIKRLKIPCQSEIDKPTNEAEEIKPLGELNTNRIDNRFQTSWVSQRTRLQSICIPREMSTAEKKDNNVKNAKVASKHLEASGKENHSMKSADFNTRPNPENRFPNNVLREKTRPSAFGIRLKLELSDNLQFLKQSPIKRRRLSITSSKHF